MEQVLLRKNEPEIKLEIIVLEDVPVKLELSEEAKPQKKQKKIKKSLLKLMEKSKYNAKYLEELVSPETAKKNANYRNYGCL